MTNNPLPPARHSSRLTEQRNPASMAIDRASIHEALAIMQAEDRKAVAAVEACGPQIERAIEMVVAAFKRGGRLVYIGAGTSGRLGVLDASEQPPTFNVPPEMVQGIIAGGWDALRRSIEGAEDKPEDGIAAMADKNIDDRDVVFGVTTGGRAPYVLAALAEAHCLGAGTILLTCTPALEGEETLADIQIHALVGPEIVTGSTRLKSGTATKLILNQITTISMIRIGKVYENLMVDLRPVNAKLVDRAQRILAEVAGLKADRALDTLRAAGMDLKVAIVMALSNQNAETARKLLDDVGGHVAEAIRRTQA